LAAVAPSDGVTANYVRRGALSRYVESAAGANPEFAQFLGAAIASLVTAGETVSEVARSWQKRRQAAATTTDATE
jgi:hypothetical protein